jgi:thiamine pyrophosphate-dependent acetolactate synthase large subunit-like protein
MIGSDVLVDQLDALDVRYVALNPGATLRGLHESLLSHGTTRAITCLHEGIAVGIAHGYAKAQGSPMGVGLHDTVGVLNAALGVYNAWADAAPMVILGGIGPLDSVERRPWIDWVHTVSDTPRPIRDLLVWAEIPSSLPAALVALRRAHQRAASTAPGPAFVGLDLSLQETDVDHPSGIAGPLTPWRLAPDGAAVEEAVRMLEACRRPVIVADRPLRDAAAATLVALAEALGAPMIDLEGGASVPVGHPLDLTEDAEATIRGADLLLLVDLRDPALVLGRLGGAASPVASIDLSATPIRDASWMITASESGCHRLVGEPGAGLALLLDRVPSRQGRPPWRVGTPATQAALDDGASLDKAALAWSVAAEAPAERVVVAYGALDGHARRNLRYRTASQYLGRSGGEGLGYGVPASIGAALALRGSDRIVIGFETDGDTLYLPQALWTAAHESIPLLAIVANNRGYKRDELHQRHIAEVRGRDADVSAAGVQLTNPTIRFADLARAFGVEASDPIATVGELRRAVARGLEVVAAGQPYVIEALTDG